MGHSDQSQPWMVWFGDVLAPEKIRDFFNDFVQTHHPRRSSVILPVIICRKSLAPAMILPISYLEHVHP